MRVLIALVLLGVSVLFTVNVSAAAEALNVTLRRIQVSLGGAVQTSVDALFYQDRAYVPVRALSEATGFQVDWVGETSTVTLAPRLRQEVRFVPPLDRGKWASATHASLQALIESNGLKSVAYDSAKRPYAVFDWDNTAIMNDTEEALFAYQIRNLAFKLTPAEFGKVIRMNVPAGPFKADYKNAAGDVVTLEGIAADLDRDYQYLYDNFKGFQGTLSIDEIRATDAFKDFETKLHFMYDAINDTHGSNVGYPWVLYFFANMTQTEVAALAEASNDYNLGQGIAKVALKSPDATAGSAGVVSSSYVTGLRLTTEIADLMHVLQANGIDVYVVTASLEDVVRVFASSPKYGYNVKPENVIGMRLEMKDDVYQAAYRQNWPLAVYHGKTEVILSEIAKVRDGRGPILVAGDSSGDYEMMTEFADTQRVLVVNRLKTGNIGKMSAQAAGDLGKVSAKVVMQGRDENTGMWIPSESTIKLGKTAKALLP